MTAEQIAELRKWVADATPPPWRVSPDSYGAFDCVWADSDIEIVRGGSDQRSDESQNRDMRAIAAMRNAFPRLLDEREALLKALRLCFHADPNEAEAARDAAIAKAEAP